MYEQSYIIRICRRAEKESGEPLIDGVVVVPASARRVTFHFLHELWGILGSTAKSQRKKNHTSSWFGSTYSQVVTSIAGTCFTSNRILQQPMAKSQER
jgi:hypothetical protein